MKTAVEILEPCMFKSSGKVNIKDAIEAMKEYAKEVAKESLKNASENATLLSRSGKRCEVSDTVNIQSTGWSVSVNKESIINEINIPEL